MIPRIYESRLNKNFIYSKLLEGEVHSQFRSVTNILFDIPSEHERLITILPPGYSGIPDSLVVPEDYFFIINRLPIGTKVFKEGFLFSFPTISTTIEGSPDSCISSNFFPVLVNKGRLILYRNRIKKFLDIVMDVMTMGSYHSAFTSFAQDRQQVISLLKLYCRALLRKDMAGILSVLPYCIGIGSGLTPSADDAVVGITAVIASSKKIISEIRLFEFENNEDIDLFESNDMKLCISKKIKGRTTDISIKYLVCAMEGRFSEVLLDLVSSLFSDHPIDWKQKIKAVADVGGTSGIDMLFGIMIAGEELINILSNYN